MEPIRQIDVEEIDLTRVRGCLGVVRGAIVKGSLIHDKTRSSDAGALLTIELLAVFAKILALFSASACHLRISSILSNN